MTKVRRTILYAEDSKYFQNKTVKALNLQGFHVITANDGQEAIEIYNDNSIQFDLILSDIIMPNVNGIELAKHNYRNKLLPFIVYTSIDENKTALKLLRYGVHDFLEKPVDGLRLVSVINNAISRWALHKDIERGDSGFSGNLHSITFPTKKSALSHANEWVLHKVQRIFDEKECDKFISFFDELLCNAYEHGNLKISEELKSRLIFEETFEKEIVRLENACDKKITVEISCLSNNIAVKITDEGDGFDYEKYLYMSEAELIERVSMPNGRGLMMAKNYFDLLRFSNNGATVFFSKEIK